MEVYVHMKDDFFMIDKFDPDYLCIVVLKACVYDGLRVDYENKVQTQGELPGKGIWGWQIILNWQGGLKVIQIQLMTCFISSSSSSYIFAISSNMVKFYTTTQMAMQMEGHNCRMKQLELRIVRINTTWYLEFKNMRYKVFKVTSC